MKKVAIIDLLFNWPPNGGSWIDVHQIAEQLNASKDYQVKLFVPDFQKYFPRGKIEESVGFEYEKIKFSLLSYNYKNVPKKFYNAIKKYAPDVVFITDGYYMKPHLINYLSLFYPIITRFYAYEIFCMKNNLFNSLSQSNCENNFLLDKKLCLKCSGLFSFKRCILKFLLKKNLHFEHEYFSSFAFKKNYDNAFIKSLQNSKHIIVYNSYLKNIVKQFNEKVTVLPTAVDTDIFVEMKPSTNKIFTFFFPGRVNDPVKGFELLKSAVKILRKEGIFVKILYTSEHNLPITNDTAFVNVGWNDRTSIIKLYQECDAVLNTSIWREAFGITVIEALSCGKPVVGAKIGGIIETIIDNYNGLHFVPNNSKSLAEKMKKLILNRDLYDMLCSNARKTAEKYNKKNVFQNFNKIVDEVVN